MSRHQWGQATKGQSGGGDPNIVTIGEKTRIRPLQVEGAPVVTWSQHIIENPRDADQVEFVICPGRGCPLCRKPHNPKGQDYWSLQTRHGANVWCYEEGQTGPKILIAGKQVFKEFDAAAEVGILPHECDWVIVKSGKGLQTSYSVQRLDKSPAEFTVEPGDLFDLSKYEKPPSFEQILEKVESMGIDYDALPVPTFTVEAALAFVLPYGKLKGETIESAMASDDQYIDWMYNAKKDRGQYGDIVFIAIHTILESQGKAEALPELDRAPGEAYSPPSEADEPPAQAPTQADSPAMVTLVGPGGDEVEVPEATADALKAAGYTKPEPPEPEPATGDVRLVKDGQEITVPAGPAADALKAQGYTEFSDLPTDAAPPREFADDEPVKVSIAGGPEVELPFSAAVQTMNAGTVIVFIDPAADAAAQTKLAFNQRQGPPARQSVAGAAMAEAAGDQPVAQTTDSVPPDPDRPFTCPHNCGEGPYKTQGALTQHINKKHDGVAPQGGTEAAPAPAESNGAPAGGDLEAARDRVKDLLAKQDTKDFTKLLDLFDEVAGVRDVMQMDIGQLAALETKLQETAQ